MKVLINITSYDRQEMLLNLTEQLEGESIIIWDDNSNFTIDGNFEFYKFYSNYGKKKAWRKFQRIFDFLLKDHKAKYYILIPDDVILCDDFVNKAIKLYESIEDKNKICLSLLSDDRIKNPNWTELHPVEKGDVVLTHWSDLCFICERKFLEEVEMKEVLKDRWDINPDLGSGVGSVISKSLYRKGYNQYHSKESLVKHIGFKSKMNLDH